MLEKIIKDYLTFSRKERTGVLLLVTLLTITLLLPYFFSEHDEYLNKTDLSNFKIQSDQVKVFKKEHDATEEAESLISGHHAFSDYKTHSPFNEKPPSKAALFYFDPNKLSGDDWKRLGLRDKTIETIHNYISKGGKFKSKEDIGKIYGLNANDVARLMPYVKINKVNYTSTQKPYEKVFYKPQSQEYFKKAKSLAVPHIVDVNLADTTELIALPGIGSKLAARIVLFREKLGGFYSVDQVAEIYGLPDSTFQKIRPVLKLSNTLLSLININTIDVNELQRHPYIRWNIASAIVAYRNQHGNYKTLEDLKNVNIVTDEIFLKVFPYLKLE